VHHGQVPVEDHDVVGVDADTLERRVPVVGHVDGERLAAQALGDRVGEQPFVFDHQHAHGVNTAPRRRKAGINGSGQASVQLRTERGDLRLDQPYGPARTRLPRSAAGWVRGEDADLDHGGSSETGQLSSSERLRRP
jgi:hypothetical protein